MIRYSEVTFDSPIHGLPGNVNSECIVEQEGNRPAYIIVRSDDGMDVCVEHVSGWQIHVPWSRVRQATPKVEVERGTGIGGEISEQALRRHSIDIDAEALLGPAKKKGGWPKGKSRKPAEPSDG